MKQIGVNMNQQEREAMDPQEREEEVLRLIAITKDFSERYEDWLYDMVCEEDPDQDLERSILQAEKYNRGKKVWAFPLDESEDGSGAWGIMVGKTFKEVKSLLESAPNAPLD